MYILYIYTYMCIYIYIYIYIYMIINLHFTSRKTNKKTDKQNYTIARYQCTGKYLGVCKKKKIVDQIQIY